jgi:hypothetical protein
VSVIIHARHQGRTLTVRWECGHVTGDEGFCGLLHGHVVSREPVRLTPEGNVREASLASPRDALDLVFYLADIVAVEGEVPSDIDVSVYLTPP